MIFNHYNHLYKHLYNHFDYKSLRVSNFWSNNNIEYETNSDGNKTLSVQEYLNKIRSYLIGIINLKKSDT